IQIGLLPALRKRQFRRQARYRGHVHQFQEFPAIHRHESVSLLPVKCGMNAPPAQAEKQIARPWSQFNIPSLAGGRGLGRGWSEIHALRQLTTAFFQTLAWVFACSTDSL